MDASLTPRRCVLLIVASICIFGLIIASFISELRLDERHRPGDYDPSSTEAAAGASEDSYGGIFNAEVDTGPNPDYYIQHLHWFVQVRDSVSIHCIRTYLVSVNSY